MQVRAVVRSASAGVAGVVLLALLAACGGGGSDETSKSTASARVRVQVYTEMPLMKRKPGPTTQRRCFS